MTDNPYDSPTRLTGTKRVKSNRKVIARPVGVSILAVFYLLGGVLAFDAQCLMFATFQGIGKSLALFGIPPVVLMIGILCLAGLWAACGAGLWFGTKWGWWLAGFFFVGNTFESGSTVVAIVSIANPLEGGRRFPVGRLIENVVRTVVNLLLLLYLF